MLQTVLAEGMTGVEISVAPLFEVEPEAGPGNLILAPLAPTLLALAYSRLAQFVVDKVAARPCEECHQFFEVRDVRQKFHSATCAGRARQRRFAERKAAAQ